MDAKEVREWRAWMHEEPRGWDRMDWLAGSIVQTISAIFGQAPPMSACMLNFTVPEVMNPDASTKGNLKLLARMFGGVIPNHVMEKLK